MITCVVIGGFCGLFYGQPTKDDSGEITDEGFPTTFESKAAIGVKVFLQLLAGASVGVWLADFVRKEEREAQCDGDEAL